VPNPVVRSIAACAIAAAALVSCATAHAQTDPFPPGTLTKLAQSTFREYLELLALPNDSVNAADIQKNTNFLELAFKKRGFGGGD
jgi:hypothetical protein